jgi:hypothetical protein
LRRRRRQERPRRTGFEVLIVVEAWDQDHNGP